MGGKCTSRRTILVCLLLLSTSLLLCVYETRLCFACHRSRILLDGVNLPGSFARSRSTFSSSSRESNWFMLVSTFTLLDVLYPESKPEGSCEPKLPPPLAEELYSVYLAVLKVRRPDVGLTDRSRTIFVELLGDVKYCTSRLLLIVE